MSILMQTKDGPASRAFWVEQIPKESGSDPLYSSVPTEYIPAPRSLFDLIASGVERTLYVPIRLVEGALLTIFSVATAPSIFMHRTGDEKQHHDKAA